jgi:hypothetical protein
VRSASQLTNRRNLSKLIIRHSSKTIHDKIYRKGATDRLQDMRSQNPWRSLSAAGNAQLLSMYPARVRAVVAPWLESLDFHWLTGAQLAELGV